MLGFPDAIFMTADSIQPRLGPSDIVLFFSLPFRPAGRRNIFFNGHIALGIGDSVYQVFNPRLLKADFLFSVMPIDDWLFGGTGKWVERDPSSPNYRHVHLYGTGESRRTVVYYARRTIGAAIAERLKEKIAATEDSFRSSLSAYSFLGNNCSSIIAAVLHKADLFGRGFFDRVPALFFRSFMKACVESGGADLGKIAMPDRSSFKLNPFCIGVPGLDPQKRVDRWLAETMEGGTRRLEAAVMTEAPWMTWPLSGRDHASASCTA
jgi:hypothetical protein